MKKYQVTETAKISRFYGEYRCITKLFDADIGKLFVPIELPLWDKHGGHKGDIVPIKCSILTFPAGNNGELVDFANITEILCCPEIETPYKINVPQNFMLLCQYDTYKKNEWDV